jgi:hypothetical protein
MQRGGREAVAVTVILAVAGRRARGDQGRSRARGGPAAIVRHTGGGNLITAIDAL